MIRPIVRAAFPTLLLSFALLARPAAAGPSVRDGLPESVRPKFDEGAELYKEGLFSEAREAFLAAHAAGGDSRILFNVAVCDKALGRYARAVATLKRSLATTDRPLPVDYTNKVSEAIATLSRYVAFVTVRSDVDGVIWTVDGEPVAENPVMLDTGSHVFVATKDGFEPATTTRSVKAGDSAEVSLSPEPSTRPGVARIDCAQVAPCAIRVGDEIVGTAPVTISRGAGVYLVHATVRGREWVTQQIQIQSGRSMEVMLTGRPLPMAHLRVTTERAEDLVSVDGQEVGASGTDVELVPGEHRVFVRRGGGVSKSFDVLLRDNETRDLRVVLEEKKGLSPWWIVGGGVVVAGVITTAAVLASQPTKYEGNAAGTLNPFIVPASLRGAR
jgi:hypothetical protein